VIKLDAKAEGYLVNPEYMTSLKEQMPTETKTKSHFYKLTTRNDVDPNIYYVCRSSTKRGKVDAVT